MDAWKTLEAAGVPIGALRAPPSSLDREAVRHALAALEGGPESHSREPLLAWLRAWRHHWPASFDATFSARGHAMIASLEGAPLDVNR